MSPIVKVPIVNGIYANSKGDFRVQYPVNYAPVPLDMTGDGTVSGYLRPYDGIVTFGTGPGVDRGGINWNGTCYRVMGTKFGKVLNDGTFVELGDVGPGGQCVFDYSFDYLGIASGGRFYLYKTGSLTQVTDPDLPVVISFIFISGYFMLTDGKFVVVTDINDPFSVNPLAYDSSSFNPDPIEAIKNLRNEAYAVNRYTVEVYQNVGGGLKFPFQTIPGAQILIGAVGPNACCVFKDTLAILGGPLSGSIGFYFAINGNYTKVSNRDVDLIFNDYTEETLSTVLIEPRIGEGYEQVLVHLPDKTLVYDHLTSSILQIPVWFILSSGLLSVSSYNFRNLVWAYDKWIGGHPTLPKLGYYSNSLSSQYEDTIGWEFNTPILYNSSKGIVINSMEFISLPGSCAFGENPTISTCYSIDGITWSQDFSIPTGKFGERNKRICWLGGGYFRVWRIQKFKGNSDSFLTLSTLQIDLKEMNN